MSLDPQRLKRENVDLTEIVRESLVEAPLVSAVSVEGQFGEPVFADVDAYKIRRVVDNLVKNAVEAMKGGGMLTVNVESRDESAVISVRDTGSGIPDEVASRMFTPFYTTKRSGNGLGLAICKQIVEAHGGKIAFETSVGKGTVFIVSLPRLNAEPRSVYPQADSSVSLAKTK